MKKLIYVVAALLIAGGAYWGITEYTKNEVPTEPVVETVSEEVVEIATEETENEETNDELNTVETNE